MAEPATDARLRASLPQIGEFLVLIELQLRYLTRMPKRVRAYSALAEEKFDLPVYPVVVNILPPGPETVISTAYDAEFLGLRARQDFRVINLWEVDAEEIRPYLDEDSSAQVTVQHRRTGTPSLRLIKTHSAEEMQNSLEFLSKG